VLEIRQKLPPNLAAHLPDELVAAQAWLAAYLQSQAHALTGFGSAGLQGGLLAYVGLVIGALIVGSPGVEHPAPLRAAARARARYFISAFRQIVVAQFWIATFNAVCTALFLFGALPLFDVHIPYSGMLVALTFFAGLIPIVGNLLCNGVLTLAGVSVAPMVGLACLMFLIAIHKFEYVINAKVVGKRTGTSAWELLTVMFVGEAIFGVAGLVAGAPLRTPTSSASCWKSAWSEGRPDVLAHFHRRFRFRAGHALLPAADGRIAVGPALCETRAALGRLAAGRGESPPVLGGHAF